jgi:pimeloyl-ACP methyl ester carboxylesterase
LILLHLKDVWHISHLTSLTDLFGRGHSSAPSPSLHQYSSALYTTQILLTLHSSPLRTWKPFTLIGYSLGGALAADFTSYFPSSISHLFLLAPGGLIRTSHITWKSRLLYSTGGIVPEWLIERLVAQRLWTGPETARTIEPEPDPEPVVIDGREAKEEEEEKGGLRGSAVYTSSHHQLLPGNPNSTVGKVVDWQIQHHAGFVPAFISSIRYAPIHGQQHRWRLIGEYMKESAVSGGSGEGAGLKEVHLILGETDPIIVADEIVEDAKEVLGQEYLRLTVMKGVGHEVAIEKAEEIADLVSGVLGL